MSQLHDWDESYRRDEPPPWDIGQPQPEIQALARSGRLSGTVLDSGCGTGEHALAAAAAGARAVGTDLSATAIRSARRKAGERALGAAVMGGDMLAAPFADGAFDTVIDSGVFHVFDDEQRGRYVAELVRVLRRDGVCHLMCFSDRQPGDWGPRRVSQQEIREAFASGWFVEAIEPSFFAINPLAEADDTRVLAWHAVLRRI
jgi:SAM-dependent methyltransferase